MASSGSGAGTSPNNEDWTPPERRMSEEGERMGTDGRVIAATVVRVAARAMALALFAGCGSSGGAGPVGKGPGSGSSSASGSSGASATGSGGANQTGSGSDAGMQTGSGSDAGMQTGSSGGAGMGSSSSGGAGDIGPASSSGTTSTGGDDGGDAALGAGARGGGGAGGGGRGAGAGDAGGAPSAGNGGNDASNEGESGGAGGGAPFTCNLLVGPSPMYQWYNGGFLTYPGIDPTRWELIEVAHHYTNAWAVPGDSAWETPVSHPCAQNSANPDRVAFMATQWAETTAAQWETDFDGIIKNIQTKWPMVKRIELMPSTCAPGDILCPAATPSASSETIIPAYGYAAIDAMPAKYPGLVFSTPHFEVPNCSDFIGNGAAPQYAPNANATTGTAVAEVAAVFGAYYAAHP